jgi:hypothetical protein
MIYQASGSQKQGVAILTSFDKVEFKPKLVRRNKEHHYILIKGTTQHYIYYVTFIV